MKGNFGPILKISCNFRKLSIKGSRAKYFHRSTKLALLSFNSVYTAYTSKLYIITYITRLIIKTYTLYTQNITKTFLHFITIFHRTVCPFTFTSSFHLFFERCTRRKTWQRSYKHTHETRYLISVVSNSSTVSTITYGCSLCPVSKTTNKCDGWLTYLCHLNLSKIHMQTHWVRDTQTVTKRTHRVQENYIAKTKRITEYENKNQKKGNGKVMKYEIYSILFFIPTQEHIKPAKWRRQPKR